MKKHRKAVLRGALRRGASHLQIDDINIELEKALDVISTDLYEIIYSLDGLIAMKEGEYCELPGSMRPSRGGKPSQKDRLRVLYGIRLLYDAQRKLLELE